MKKFKWLATLFTGMAILLGVTTPVHAVNGTLTITPSTHSGRMEFRRAGATQNSYEDYMILNINGEPVFCLEPSIEVFQGAYVGREFNDVERINANIQIDKATFNRLTLITYYGYKVNPNHKNYHYTQALIWETLGSRAVSFNGTLSMSEYQAWKANVLNNVNNFKQVSSFHGQSHTLKVGESITLTDNYNVIQNLFVPAENGGYKFVRNGNQLTITATPNAADGRFTFSQFRDNRIHGASIIFRKAGSQTVGSFKLRDPQGTFVNLTAIKNGIIRIHKTSELDGQSIEGVEFAIVNKATGQELSRQKTDKSGVIIFRDLPANVDYIVKETKVANGYLNKRVSKEHRLQPGQEFTMTFTNEPTTAITSQATAEQGGKAVYAHENQIEKVNLDRLIKGRDYKVVSTQYDKATGKALSHQEKTFRAVDRKHTLSFTYKAPSDLQVRWCRITLRNIRVASYSAFQ
ncbi:Cys-Gln thioester bond-forming surface protein [Carnobacteriaceae bacterium zg-C25]|nr:Cys-Gln thioester bond-forming surface protein [Carnobacteriaceae bacterium zg-C25]